jgi:uncharacterized repeat protein (TIGR03803 family)
MKIVLREAACFICVLCLADAIASPAQTFTTLSNFNEIDGSPNSLVQGTDGNFYGTTAYGGAISPCPPSNDGPGCGTVFEITPAGLLTTLHSFNGSDGSAPNGLIEGSDGKFYGITSGGGILTQCNGSGCGTIFSIIPGGTPVTLYNFCSQTNCADGSNPSAPLAQGTDGNFYGTTAGGANNSGTFFKITPSGALNTIYSFDGNNFSAPNALVQGTDGNFYGTTVGGGALGCGPSSPFGDCGTILKITPEGVPTLLYSFCLQHGGCPDGSNPSGLVQGTDGNFYGTTAHGGNLVACDTLAYPVYFSCGTVFKITPGGTLTTLHLFDSTDGGWPLSGMIQGNDGNFYGTTELGGANGLGTIFKMTPAGTLITLYTFPGPGGGPAWLIQAASGIFYGITASGGTNYDSTVFSFAIGLSGTTASTTGFSLSPASVTVGSSGVVVMTATVAPGSGSGTPTGVVAFFNGSSEVGSSNLAGGTATFDYNPSSLALGTYPMTAIYSGDNTFATSTSSAQTLTINSLPAAATPTFSPAPGNYSSAQMVTISDTTTGAAIYYTNDGTTPTTGSAVYNGPITVNSTQTLQAIAGASGYNNSAVASATYTITLSPDYQLAVAPTTLTIVAGQSATATFTVTPMNGFNSEVSFACSGLPSGATCSFAPSSVTPSGGNAASSTLTISTTTASAALRGPGSTSHRLIYAMLLPFVGMIFGIAARRKQSQLKSRLYSMGTVLLLAAGLASCGSNSTGSNSTGGAQPVTSAVTVTASTSGTGAINHTTALTITITP